MAFGKLRIIEASYGVPTGSCITQIGIIWCNINLVLKHWKYVREENQKWTNLSKISCPRALTLLMSLNRATEHKSATMYDPQSVRLNVQSSKTPRRLTLPPWLLSLFMPPWLKRKQTKHYLIFIKPLLLVSSFILFGQRQKTFWSRNKRLFDPGLSLHTCLYLCNMNRCPRMNVLALKVS